MVLLKRLGFLLLGFLLLNGCAVMHHTQIGEIDSKMVSYGQRFEILLSETGINLEEGAAILKGLTSHKKTSGDIGKAQDIISMFQVGPRTGNQIFNDKYADPIFNLLRTQCPTGNLSGLTIIRESNKYPVVSGEIVKITGYCYKKKEA